MQDSVVVTTEHMGTDIAHVDPLNRGPGIDHMVAAAISNKNVKKIH